MEILETKIDFLPFPEGINGACYQTSKGYQILLRDGMSISETKSVLSHELRHILRDDFSGESVKDLERSNPT